jgi:hypothetical protein
MHGALPGATLPQVVDASCGAETVVMVEVLDPKMPHCWGRRRRGGWGICTPAHLCHVSTRIEGGLPRMTRRNVVE